MWQTSVRPFSDTAHPATRAPLGIRCYKTTPGSTPGSPVLVQSSLTCWQPAGGALRAWAAGAGCTWPPGTGRRCGRPRAARSAARRAPWPGSCGWCARPRRTAEGWAGDTNTQQGPSANRTGRGEAPLCQGEGGVYRMGHIELITNYQENKALFDKQCLEIYGQRCLGRILSNLEHEL